MAESRLQRWSRKKAEAGKESGRKTEPSSAALSEPSPEEQELAVNEALPEYEVLEKYDLPAPDSIVLGTDITGFMRKEIPELLRRKALRALWKSNPVLAVLDGLNDYDEDFSNAATAASSLQNLHKVGRDFIDRTAQVDEHIDEKTGKEAEENAQDYIRKPAEYSETTPPDEMPARSEPEIIEAAETEVEPTPHYRPRMRFTS
jgi:hypothetical protein